MYLRGTCIEDENWNELNEGRFIIWIIYVIYIYYIIYFM